MDFRGGNKFYQVLDDLKKNSNIAILKPDKCNGKVILNKTDYVSKV